MNLDGFGDVGISGKDWRTGTIFKIYCIKFNFHNRQMQTHTHTHTHPTDFKGKKDSRVQIAVSNLHAQMESNLLG